jgi:cytochrome c5
VVRAITTGLSAANLDHLDVSLQEVFPRDYHYLNAVSQGAFAPKYDLTPRDEPEFDPANLHNGYRDTYYGKVDPRGLRTTLEDWRAHHRFDDFPLSTSHATFINAGDLDPGQTGGLGRDMFCLNDGRAFPCYVQNYLDPKGVNGDPDQIGRDMVATVAMERMLLTEGVHDREIVAFFVFDKDGKRINRIALDSEGEKAVPEQCYGCHMGQTHPFDTDQSGNFTVGLGVPAGGQYLPFDINSFENWPGQPTLADQAHEFRRLNEHVRSAAQNRKESIQNLILGWYGREPGDFVHFDDTYDGSFIPDEWFTDPQGFEVPGSPAFDLYFQERSLYANVYQRYCRTCHVAQGEAQNNYPTRGVNWEKASAFCVEAQRVACSDTFTPRMPHAEHTFNRFVNDVLNFTNGTSATPQQVLCDTPCVVGQTGEQLYTTYCSSCHGDLANSTKKGRTAAQITSAIQLQPPMSSLNTLTQDQIEAIADALQ